MIEQSTIDRVLAAADIVDVVKDFVALRKTGASYKGLCPFHEDRTPSFIVTPAKGLCKCFACGAGGNVVKFVQMHEQLSWPEAIKYLAAKYGIEVEESGRSDEQKERSKEREALFVVNEWARDWFVRMLHEDPDGIAVGMTYFRGRGFRDDTIRKFQLGFCPDRRDAMSQAAVKAGYGERLLVNDAESRQGTGVSFKNDKGGLTDRFRGRVIFPIHTVSGRVVGFGGRVLAKATKGVSQKYVNSPESTIYSKSRELYGLFQAKQAIVKQNCCYLVEGYTDVISMHQSGVENVVASSGTALTTGQINLLHRFTNNVTMIYDGDEAGIHAALRGTDMLLSQGLNIKVLLLPDGEDPDSFARSHKAEELRQYIADHEVDFIRFKTEVLLAGCKGDPVRKAEVVGDIVNSIAVIPGDILRQTYAHECAEQMGMAESVIVKAVADRRARSIIPEKGVPAGGAVVRSPETETSPQGGSDEKNTVGDARETATSTEQRMGIEERNLAFALIRWGGMSFRFADEEEDCNVTDFIVSELEVDDIVFDSELCRRVLSMSQELRASGTAWTPEEWTARFTLCEDEAIAAMAAVAVTDVHRLPEPQRKLLRSDESRLAEIVPRLVCDLKFRLIAQQVQAVQTRLRQPEVMRDPELLSALLTEYRDLSAIQREVGRMLGDRIMKSPRGK